MTLPAINFWNCSIYDLRYCLPLLERWQPESAISLCHSVLVGILDRTFDWQRPRLEIRRCRADQCRDGDPR